MITTNLYSSIVFDQLTQIILNSESIDRYHKLRLHTWFAKVDFNHPDQYRIMCENLHSYISTGEQNSYLVETTSAHPKMFDWFGKPLVGNEVVLNLLKRITDESSIPNGYIASDYLAEVEEFFSRMRPADTLVKLLGKEPEVDVLRFIICNELPNPYNVHPDTIVHKRMSDKLWYIAGLGHEFGHILTWDLNKELHSLGLLSSPVTKQFPEMLAHLCNKLLLDYYGHSISDLDPEYHAWSEFGFAQSHPGMELHKKMLDVVDIDNAKNLQEISIDLLSQYQ